MCPATPVQQSTTRYECCKFLDTSFTDVTKGTQFFKVSFSASIYGAVS